jgi:antitoxin ParD1/3/4
VRQQCRSAAVSTLAGAVFASIVVSTKRVRLASFAKQWYSKRQLKRRQMPTRNISLTAEQDAFVQEVVEAGEYQNASEAIRDALRVLQQRRNEDTLKLKVLRAQIKAGTDALDRGDFTDVDDADLEGYLNRLTIPPAKRTR